MVLKPDAALVQDDTKRFRKAVEEHYTNGNLRVVIDLADVPFIDSEGLEALLDLAEHAHVAGGGLRIASPCDISSDILVATRIGSRIQVYSDVSEARKSLT